MFSKSSNFSNRPSVFLPSNLLYPIECDKTTFFFFKNCGLFKKNSIMNYLEIFRSPSFTCHQIDFNPLVWSSKYLASHVKHTARCRRTCSMNFYRRHFDRFFWGLRFFIVPRSCDRNKI
jgi:hypothetical protein